MRFLHFLVSNMEKMINYICKIYYNLWKAAFEWLEEISFSNINEPPKIQNVIS